MPIIQRKEYNILVLGETGAGKSTFINGFLNYLSFETLHQALASPQAKYCIPTIFGWYSNDKEYHVVIGRNEDVNEHQEIGQSATQSVRSYLFEFENIGIRIIDTPGFGDTEGRKKDEQIAEKLFNFLSVREDLRELHGIILVYQPQTNRKTTFFKYCIDHIFSKLHGGSSQNIIFVFTHTKATNYKPGPTSGLIRSILKDIPGKNLKCEKENMFCVENDCIKYLLAFFYNTDNIIFDDDEEENYIQPWKKSSAEYIRLFKYIKDLRPHSVSDTVLINSARYYIVKLESHLPKILEKIVQNIKTCKEIEMLIEECGDNITKLEKVLYTKTYIKRESGKHVVCTNVKCSKKETHGKNKEACCPNCTALSLSSCLNMEWWGSKCKVCGCYQLDHIYEDNNDHTGVETKKNEDIQENINTKQKTMNAKRVLLFKLKLDIKKYQAESLYIENWVRRLSKYLNESSISSDQRRFDDTNNTTNDEPISVEEIGRIMETLSTLKMTGGDIQKLFKKENMTIEQDKIFVNCDDVPANWREAFEQSA